MKCVWIIYCFNNNSKEYIYGVFDDMKTMQKEVWDLFDKGEQFQAYKYPLNVGSKYAFRD